MKRIFSLLLLAAAIIASIYISRCFSWDTIDSVVSTPLNDAANNVSHSAVFGLLNHIAG